MISATDITLGKLFSGLSFALKPGEIVGLIGPPEAGKSVLLKLLAGLLDPDSGAVTIDGDAFAGKPESARYPIRRKIGMLFQNTALFDFMTIFDNVAFPLRGEGSAATHAEAVMERLQAVGLTHAAKQYPHELSGGMKKRAGLARATITRPQYCFYDEPTAGLDPVTAAKIYRLIRQFAEHDNAGAVVISNELDTLLPACHRVVMLFEGRIIYSGPPAALQSADHPAVRQFATGSNAGPL